MLCDKHAFDSDASASKDFLPNRLNGIAESVILALSVAKLPLWPGDAIVAGSRYNER
ncbi:hypothetical protein Q31b_20600 [Novipirellula aureliae]|uniref:Uncharacterized protein n=1 Tax=Novipirellula aureliae TaxID=2527966 RepID=A0A5C6E2S7_9BACT|nr:hypothetical protein [Novipirellula aureliae]TWU43025.1 hypothetical protein Q31b_20600 [Novipirellula aureliae]